MKKVLKMVGTVCYEAIALIALYLTIFFIGVVAEGDLISAMNHADFEDFAIIMLMLAGVRITIYDCLKKAKMIRNWWFKEIKG